MIIFLRGPSLRFSLLKLDARSRDGLAASQDRNVFEHGLTAIAEPGSFHRGALESARSLFTTKVARLHPQRPRKGPKVLADLGSLFSKAAGLSSS